MLEKNFDPKTAEPRLYAAWEASGAFAPTDDPAAEPFSIVVRRPDRPPASAAGRLLRLEPRALHAGRGPLRSRAEGVRHPLQGRADLPRQAAGELGPALPDRHFRPGGRAARGRRAILALRLS